MYPFVETFNSYNTDILTFFFPLTDEKTKENTVFIDTIIDVVDCACDIDIYDVRKSNILVVCGAGLSRSPYIASRLLSELRYNIDGLAEEYYYRFKSKNPMIKSIFIE